MSRGHRQFRVDGNHAEVIKALRSAGMYPVSTAVVGEGFGDVAVGWRGANFLLEVKDGSHPPSKRVLTVDEKFFHALWPGQICVVETPEAAVIAVCEAAKKLGLV